MNVLALYNIVWDFRQEHAHLWPTPLPDDCRRYAVTEAGEAMDAWLRINQTSHVRNNDREISIEDELADCAIMLLSSMPDEMDEPPKLVRTNYPLDDVDRLEHICYQVARHLYHQGGDSSAAFIALSFIYYYPGINLKDRITARLSRIKANVT